MKSSTKNVFPLKGHSYTVDGKNTQVFEKLEYFDQIDETSLPKLDVLFEDQIVYYKNHD